MIDDNIVVGRGWLGALVSPILRQGYDPLLGPVLPLRVETEAEKLFEAYCALGHQSDRAEYDSCWLRARRWWLPLWQIGGLGNAAVRREIFEDKKVGYLEQALGVGTPAGSSED